MHITRIELENIKSHTDSKFKFQRGTTAITGANGTGKTTIIEAVAWTLFDLLDYKKDDFARRGTNSKGSARVTFESSLDEREYTVYRDTSTGYYVYDPRLKMRIAEKKEEVQRFIRQHLGVEPGTDLETLFRRAIGVPQGTFTAIFLESPTERKKAFDKLLKVEEYRQGAEKLRETASYIETRINHVRERIARAEGELSRFESLEDELNTTIAKNTELETTLAELTRQIEIRTKVVAEFDRVEEQLNALRKNYEKKSFEFESLERDKARIDADFQQAKEAAEKLRTLEKDHFLHLTALEELTKLEHQRTERDKAQLETTAIETKIVNARAEQKIATEKAQKAHEAGQQILKLEPQIVEQKRLEHERELLRDQLADAKMLNSRIESKEREIDERRKIYKENKKKIEEAQAKSALAVDLKSLISRDTEITLELAKLRASLDRDEKFQREIKNGLCPILSQKCLNLEQGQTLEDFVGSQFSDHKARISELETEHLAVSIQLAASREGEKFMAALESYRQRESDITAEAKRLQAEIDELQKSASGLPGLQKRFDEIETKLRGLNNPREQAEALKKEAETEPGLHERQREMEKVLEELDRERLLAGEKLEQFSDVEMFLKKYQSTRDLTLSAHREFLVNERLANSFAQREKDSANINVKIESTGKDLGSLLDELNAVDRGYDRDAHQNEKNGLLIVQKSEAETKATFEFAKNTEEKLRADIEILKRVRQEMQAEFAEKERLEKIFEATRFIRDTLKEAAPQVARNYVFHVSNEANQMYREITGNAERTLKWTEDYGITLEENGYDRPFINLSGGEQMAAALSVRLAILKQLSDIRIAFFDEPTTNMDAERRENLATQIGNIRHFDQLFVISHDDAFEGYADNVVNLGMMAKG